MPRSIESVQRDNRFIGAKFGSNISDFDEIEFTGLAAELKKYADLFIDNMAASARKHKVVASGKMIGEAESVLINNDTGFQIRMVNYYDYPNKGVRGVKSSTNAPNSPYKYKSLYTMSAEGRASLKDYIEKGRAKIKTVQNTKTLVGLEVKKKSLIDLKVDELIYNIKKYGIKTTNYFDEAIAKTFDNKFYVAMAEAVGNDIIYTLKAF